MFHNFITIIILMHKEHLLLFVYYFPNVMHWHINVHMQIDQKTAITNISLRLLSIICSAQQYSNSRMFHADFLVDFSTVYLPIQSAHAFGIRAFLRYLRVNRYLARSVTACKLETRVGYVVQWISKERLTVLMSSTRFIQGVLWLIYSNAS